MKINVKLFAMTREIAKTSELSIDIPDDSTALAALEIMYGSFPAMRSYHDHLRVAVNREYVGLSHVLRENDEVAVIPPVSGG